METLKFSITGEAYYNILRNLFLSEEYSVLKNIIETDLSEFLTAKNISLQRFATDLLIYKKYIIEGLNTLEIHINANPENDKFTMPFIKDRLRFAFEDFNRKETFNLSGLESIIDNDLLTKLCLEILHEIYSKISQSTGYILKNGLIIFLNQREHHYFNEMLLILKKELNINLVDYFIESIKFSSKAIVWGVGTDFSAVATEDVIQNIEQLKSCLQLLKSDNIDCLYFDRGLNIYDWLIEETIKLYNKGRKYGILQFMHQIYDFKIPIIDCKSGKVIVRTSPEVSNPGVLTSIVCEYDEANRYADIIQKEASLKNINCKVHTFNQQFVPGIKVVVNSIKYKAYISHDDLPMEINNEIHRIVDTLNYDFRRDFQLELVCHKTVQLVQFRFLNNLRSEIKNSTKSSIVDGNSFSSGEGIYDYSDVLIVESDDDTMDLRKYKALVIKDSPQFSHLLALSLALEIPSCYGVDIDTLKQTMSEYKDCLLYINTENLNSIINIHVPLSK